MEEMKEEKHSIEELVPSDFLKRFYQLNEYGKPIVFSKYWMKLENLHDIRQEEIVKFRVNLTKRFIIRRKYLKIIFSRIPLLKEIKMQIKEFIGLENFEDLFKSYFQTK
tara:strand:- start:607 stop:933 length:327 start_codon:yes stop_codon:yes gene_type:complete